MHWPQVGMIVYLAGTSAAGLFSAKDSKRAKVTIIATILHTAIILLLLGFGGFWG